MKTVARESDWRAMWKQVEALEAEFGKTKMRNARSALAKVQGAARGVDLSSIDELAKVVEAAGHTPKTARFYASTVARFYKHRHDAHKALLEEFGGLARADDREYHDDVAPLADALRRATPFIKDAEKMKEFHDALGLYDSLVRVGAADAETGPRRLTEQFSVFVSEESAAAAARHIDDLRLSVGLSDEDFDRLWNLDAKKTSEEKEEIPKAYDGQVEFVIREMTGGVWIRASRKVSRNTVDRVLSVLTSLVAEE